MSIDSTSLPSREQAEAAVRVLIEWIGDCPERDGLKVTPSKVLDMYEKTFSGYGFDEEAVLKDAVFRNDAGYTGMIVAKRMGFSSSCEHHCSAVIGKASVAYIPKDNILGIGRIKKIVDGFSRRLTLQERATVQIAEFLEKALVDPVGVAVLIEGEHMCVECDGGKAQSAVGLRIQTSHMLGIFRESDELRHEFFTRLKL